MGELIYTKLYELSSTLLNFLVFNLIWLILNLPVAFLIFQLALSTSLMNYYILLPLLFLFLPIVSFPSTQALFSTMRETVTEEETLDIIGFFKRYKEGFKGSLLAGILYTGLIVLFSYILYSSWSYSLLLFTVILISFCFLGVMILYYFLFEAHFNMPFYWKLKQSIVFVLANPVSSILISLVFIGLQSIVWSITPILFILLGTAGSCYFTIYLFLKKYDKVLEKSRK